MLLCLPALLFCQQEGDNSIPVLDLNEYYNSETREQFIDQMRDALSEYGFFAMINTGIDQEVVDRAYEASKEFFALPFETKMKYDITPTGMQRGYAYYGIETAQTTQAADFKEFFFLGRDLTDEEHTDRRIPKNQWPEETSLKADLKSYFSVLEGYMETLQECFCCVLDLPLDYFHTMTKEGDCMMRSIHYPAPKLNVCGEGSVWAAEHTDTDLYAILPKATCDGLEVKKRDGTWVRVQVPDDSFIINGGDYLENLSNGLLQSSVHRVVSLPGEEAKERFSIVYFIHPRPSDDMSPLPHIIEQTGGVQKFPNATRQELLFERLVNVRVATEWMIDEVAESGVVDRMIDVGRDNEYVLRQLEMRGLASEKVLDRLAELDQ